MEPVTWRMRRAAVAAVGLAIGMIAALPASAIAGAIDERFAAPMAHPMANPADCAEAMPCDIETAVEHGSVDEGDTITLLPGDYTLIAGQTISALKDVLIRGKPGAARPRLISAAANAVELDDSLATTARPRLSDVVIDHSGSNIGVISFGGIAERVEVTTSTMGAACGPFSGPDGDGLFRDSVCRNTAGGSAVGVFIGSLTPQSTRGVIRNVTAIATGGATAAALFANSQDGGTALLDARNVIARGQGSDVTAAHDTGAGTSTVTLASSNYAVELELGGSTVTDPGTAGNQVAPPMFVDQPAGDFRQTTASPTVNAGTGDALLGATDLHGGSRTIGCAVDIGADELDAGPPCPRDASVKPKSKCKKKRKKKSKAAAKKRCKKKKKSRQGK